MKVVISTENASMQMSGEAALALYYFDLLRERGIDVWMVCHERAKNELQQLYADPAIFARIQFIKDTALQRFIVNISDLFPFIIKDRMLSQVVYVETQRRLRLVVKQLVANAGIQLVYQPNPISPKAPSFMYNLGVPVVIGPMCGGMEFPPAFRHLESAFERFANRFGRGVADLLHRFIPGKLEAAALLVANDRTAASLPRDCSGKIYQVVESGVDLSLWQPRPYPQLAPGEPTRFVYMARFVDQKGIPYLVEAFQQVAAKTNAVLELIGNGELFEQTKAQVAALKITDRVNFHGWMALDKAAALIQDCHVYMVPAIRDCGGCAMLEAMAIGMPVIAANWAGPGEYADESCGILVDLETEADFVNGLAAAMIRLANSPELCQKLSAASRQRVSSNYLDWDSKVDRVIEIFQETLAAAAANAVPLEDQTTGLPPKATAAPTWQMPNSAGSHSFQK